MTFKEFEDAFGPVVRSLLNTKRGRKEDWPVSMKIIHDRDELGDFQVTWYGDGDLLDQHSQRLLVSEAGVGHSRVLEIAGNLAHAQRPYVVWTLPCYKLKKGYLLLDGCHRASALWLAAVPFSLILFVVNGPKDERGLWDLANDV